MMIKILLIFFIIILTHGCENLKKSLGVKKELPDEFLIKKIDKIEMPPNYDLLPPGKKERVIKKNKTAKDIIDSNIQNNQKVNDQKIDHSTSNIESDILKEINKKND